MQHGRGKGRLITNLVAKEVAELMLLRDTLEPGDDRDKVQARINFVQQGFQDVRVFFNQTDTDHSCGFHSILAHLSHDELVGTSLEKADEMRREVKGVWDEHCEDVRLHKIFAELVGDTDAHLKWLEKRIAARKAKCSLASLVLLDDDASEFSAGLGSPVKGTRELAAAQKRSARPKARAKLLQLDSHTGSMSGTAVSARSLKRPTITVRAACAPTGDHCSEASTNMRPGPEPSVKPPPKKKQRRAVTDQLSKEDLCKDFLAEECGIIYPGPFNAGHGRLGASKRIFVCDEGGFVGLAQTLVAGKMPRCQKCLALLKAGEFDSAALTKYIEAGRCWQWDWRCSSSSAHSSREWYFQGLDR